MTRNIREMVKMHPCAAALGGGCKGLTGDAREAGMKKYGADCGEKRAERQQKFMDNHPCAAPIVTRPGKDVTGEMQRAACIDK